MKRINLAALAAFAAIAVVAVACGPKLQAPAASDGGPSSLYIYVDRNLAACEKDRWTDDWETAANRLEDSLRNHADRMGYAPYVIGSPQEFQPGPDSYLLSVTIDKFNPGSKAARVMVGYGAGEATLKVGYSIGDGTTAQWQDNFQKREDPGTVPSQAARKIIKDSTKALTGM